FFFSSRRRHTRSKRDWSSDVCSSDLALPCEWLYPACPRAQERPELAVLCYPRAASVRGALTPRPSSVVARRVLVRPQISCGLSRGRRVLATECHRQAPARTSAYWRRTCSATAWSCRSHWDRPNR